MTEHEVIIEFELKDDKLTKNTDKVIETLKEIKETASEALEKGLGNIFDTAGDASEKAGRKMKQLKDTSKSSKAVLASIGATAVKAGKSILSMAKNSAEFVGTQTRFNAVFDKTNGELEKAQKWVDDYADALYLDKKAVMDTVSGFMIFGKTIGLTNDKTKEISKNMTQLANDMGAVYGVDATTMSKQITSALAGQAKALKQYGVVINNAILQERLYELGINRKISSLNAAERAEITYYHIMQQTAGQQGYLAKTLMSPANAANILKNQFTQLARAIGNVFLPILMKALPVIIAITQALTNLAQRIANVFGLNIDFGKYETNIGGISAGIDDIGDSADGASKKIKNMLRDFDDLHVVDFGDDSTGGGGAGVSGGGAGGLGIDTQQYADWSKYLDDAMSKVGVIKDYLIAIGIALASWKIADMALNFFNKLFDWGMTGGEILLKGLGVGLFLGGAYLSYKGITKILDGEITTESILEVISGGASAFAGGLALTGGKIRLAIGLTLALEGALLTYGSMKKILNGEMTSESILGLIAGNASVFGSVLTLTKGNIKLALGVTLALDTFMSTYEGAKKMLSGDFSWGSVLEVVGGSVGTGLAALIATGSWKIAAGALILSLVVSFAIASIEDIKGVIDKVKKAFENEKTKKILGDIGKWIVLGVITGITTAIYGIPALIIFGFLTFAQIIIDVLKDIFEIHSPSKKMMKYGEYIILGLFEGIKSLFGNVKEIFIDLKNRIVERFEDIKSSVLNKVQEIKNNATNKFQEMKDSVVNKFVDMKNGVSNKIQEIKDSVSNKFDNIKDTISNKIESAKNKVRDTISEIKGFLNFSWSLPEIKTPQLTWTSTPASGWIAKTLDALGLPTSLPKLNVKWFAEGGFPNKGDLFIANEREPELIGSMGNRTTVANNNQIIEGISDASYSGMKKALSEVEWGSGDTLVYVGNTQLTDVITKKQKLDNKRFGR